MKRADQTREIQRKLGEKNSKESQKMMDKSELNSKNEAEDRLEEFVKFICDAVDEFVAHDTLDRTLQVPIKFKHTFTDDYIEGPLIKRLEEEGYRVDIYNNGTMYVNVSWSTDEERESYGARYTT